MAQKLLAALVYGVTGVSFGSFFEALYAGEPIAFHLTLIHLATAGAVLFAVACFVCLFSLRLGGVLGVFARLFSWPFLGIELAAFPWRNLIWAVHYRPETLSALVTLTLSSICSMARISLFLVPRSAGAVGKQST